jgi:hypothetical protein
MRAVLGTSGYRTGVSSEEVSAQYELLLAISRYRLLGDHFILLFLEEIRPGNLPHKRLYKVTVTWTIKMNII